MTKAQRKFLNEKMYWKGYNDAKRQIYIDLYNKLMGNAGVRTALCIAELVAYVSQERSAK